MTWNQLSYYLGFGWQALILGRRKPIVAGIPVTDLCNLRCRHCVVAHAGRGHHSFQTITGWMRLLYERGARILYLQGGEPFGWSDGERRLDHLIREARRMGFFKVATVTNGTYPIETEADLVWVSVDGYAKGHDAIRGPGAFERLVANLDASGHPNVYANMTLNRLNHGEAESVLRFATGHPRLRGVSFNFHTPYPGVEELALSREERGGMVRNLVRWKRQGLPVVNSVPALRLLASGSYRRPVSLIQMVERGELFECCWGRGEPGVCERCGYGVIAELSALSRMKPASLLGSLRLFIGSGARRRSPAHHAQGAAS